MVHLRSRPWLAPALIVFGAIVYSTGPLYRVRTWWPYSDPLAADVAVVAVQVLVGVGAVLGLVGTERWRRIDPRIAAVALLLVAWMAIGSLWSDDPSTTLRESLMVGVALLVGIAAAAATDERVLVGAAWAGLQCGLAWSAVTIFLEQPGSQDGKGQWAGVFFNPNSLALVAAFGILLSVVLAVQWARHPQRVPVLGVTLVATLADLWLISGTDALTPLIGLAAGGAVAAFAVLGRRWVGPSRREERTARTVSALAGLVLLIAGTLAWWARSAWLASVGRTMTLTGRTEMWEVALDWFPKRPFTGQGYLGAWSNPEFAADMLAARGEVLGSTHSTFIELLLGTGLVGFGLALALFGLIWIAAGSRALRGNNWVAVWPLAMLVFLIMENLVETLLVGGQLTVVALGVVSVVSTREPVAEPPTNASGPRIDDVVVGLEDGN